MHNKKGFLATGVTTVMMYLGIFLLIIMFFFVFKLTKEDAEVKIAGHITDVDKNLQLLNYLRTPVIVDGSNLNVAELIALSETDSSKRIILEQKLVELMDASYSTCAIMCINDEKFKSSSCDSGIRDYRCPVDSVFIPGYGGKPIGIRFDPDSESLTLQITRSRYGAGP